MFRALSAFTLASFFVASFAFAEAKSYSIDPSVSSLEWTGRKLLGSFHNGQVQLKNGSAVVEGGTLVGGNFEIDMSTISVADIKDPKDNQKLTGHLKSDDFFKVQAFPASTFKFKKATPIANAAPGQANYEITGDLSILGITKSITFPATVTVTSNEASATGKVTVDRTLWNIRYGSGKFFDNLGDKVIKDEFEVALNLKAKA
jgi:polyisoprenoid-binding protein YceI